MPTGNRASVPGKQSKATLNSKGHFFPTQKFWKELLTGALSNSVVSGHHSGASALW